MIAQNRKALLIIPVASLIVIFLLIGFFLNRSQTGREGNNILPTPIQENSTVLEDNNGNRIIVTPPDNSALLAGRVQTFTVQFSQQIKLDNIVVALSGKKVLDDIFENVSIATSLSTDKKT